MNDPQIEQIIGVAARVDRTKCGVPVQDTCRFGGPDDYHAMHAGHTADNSRKVGVWLGDMGTHDISAAIGCVDLTRSTIKLIQAPDRLPGKTEIVVITWVVITCETTAFGPVTIAASDPLQ